MIGLAIWQSLLDAVGSLVAWLYGVIGNYGVTIVALTVVIRVVLLPLGIRQIRSMQSMQIIQPEIKRLQTKFKGDRVKLNEATMRLYKEHGVNPFSGCWPVLLQFPILIAMYSVLRHPQHPPHLPEGSALRTMIEVQLPPDGPGTVAPASEGTQFLGMNLLCAPNQAGSGTAFLRDPVEKDANGDPLAYPVDCGEGLPSRIPYFIFAALMFATTWYQQKQMQAATPKNAASDQQQALLKVMPIMFGVFGFFFPAGLVLYWSTSNLWQIGQQYFMLRSRPTAETLKQQGAKKASKKGMMERAMERAEEERKARENGRPPKKKGDDEGRR